MNYKKGTQTRGCMKSVMRYVSQMSKTLWDGQQLVSGIIMVYLLGVLLTSAFTSGYICGVLAAFLSVILFNYFLTKPRLSLVA